MSDGNKEFIARIHQRFASFKTLQAELGPDGARKAMLEAMTEKERKRMAPFLAKPTLFAAFTSAVPFFAMIGMKMEVVDITNNGSDAVLEIQKYCPYLAICKEYGFDTPCATICEIDIAAIQDIFPELQGEILSRHAEGSAVCLFKYERAPK